MSTSRAIRRGYDARLAEIGLTLSEASLLAYAGEQGPMTQTRLAAGLDIGRATIGVTIDSLEARGLVERRVVPSDRRARLVALTAEGQLLTVEISRIDKVFREELRAGISRDDRKQLAHTLLCLQENLASMPHQASGNLVESGR